MLCRFGTSDGCRLTANEGITVNSSDSLTIYGQEESSGMLIARGAENSAGIGGNANYASCGTVTVHGGVVNASYLSSSSRESAVIGGHLSYKPPVTITGGTSATIYSPNAPCTRAQMAAFIYRNEQANGNGFTGAWMFRIPFADAPEWAYESIAWCYKEGITSGTSSTTFSPDDPCTRAQMVTFLYRCFGE